jgi:hypothetical protein
MGNESQFPLGAKPYEFDGKRMTIYQWAKFLTTEWGIPVSHTALLVRLARHWTLEDTLTVRLGERRQRRAGNQR